MTISEIITKYYDQLHSQCDPNIRYANSATEEDFLQDVCIKALTKYGDDDISEKEGKDYLEKTLFTQMAFKMKQFSTDNLVFFENINTIDGEENE